MNRRITLLIASVLLASIAAPMSVSAEAENSRSTPVVKIGFLNEMTGPIAAYADGFSAAMEIAEDHINSMQSQYIFELVEAGIRDVTVQWAKLLLRAWLTTALWQLQEPLVQELVLVLTRYCRVTEFLRYRMQAPALH